jgi:hypothetical protein
MNSPEWDQAPRLDPLTLKWVAERVGARLPTALDSSTATDHAYDVGYVDAMRGTLDDLAFGIELIEARGGEASAGNTGNQVSREWCKSCRGYREADRTYIPSYGKYRMHCLECGDLIRYQEG